MAIRWRPTPTLMASLLSRASLFLPHATIAGAAPSPLPLPTAALPRQRRPPHDTASPATHRDRRDILPRRHVHPQPAARAGHPAPGRPPPFLQPSTPPLPPPLRQQQQGKHHRSPPVRLIRSMRAAFRSFPILPAPSCRGLPSLHHLPGLHSASVVKNHFHGSTRTTGTLYGHRRARITIAFHDSPGSPPGLLLELGVPTAKFIQDVSAAGMVRVTLECDKQQHQHQHHHAGEAPAPRRLLDEPVWAAEVNGESVGYAARREATEGDERVMRLLHATSMGAGVLPADMAHPADGELTYMRAHFDRVVGSKDSETYYMQNPEGCATGPELTIFFIRT